ncbi:hypothetical protein H0A36_14925 [Endozoicomonas sp. SM1973]|uniref:RHS repeat protein n=1 Tax=Spartinivicinus marinus TaxID=2994442 RepID=A0A853I3V1_9GAMM|nr:hypothetical protein [Spartinivicinus marinus]MCX4026345.1 hypothetical protein [Spartinivicinus marinus]NYZ67309.1 hypothetical protein [Spartinivicinus marinus]
MLNNVGKPYFLLLIACFTIMVNHGQAESSDRPYYEVGVYAWCFGYDTSWYINFCANNHVPKYLANCKKENGSCFVGGSNGRCPSDKSDCSEQNIYYSKRLCADGLEPNKNGSCDRPSPLENGQGNCTRPSGGNPIIVSNGNKFQSFTNQIDNVPFTISFNSSTGKTSHSFEYRYKKIHINAQDTTSPVYIDLHRPSGLVIRLVKQGDKWTSPDQNFVAEQVNIKLEPKDGYIHNGYIITMKIVSNGNTEYYFDNGYIYKIQSRGNTKYFYQPDGTSDKVIFSSTQSEKQITLLQGKNGITSIKGKSGQEINYNYDEQGRLSGITNQKRKLKVLHYENADFPYHLTGITDENGVRFATWTYDNQGRAISSEHAGGKEKITLEFHDNNSTTVTNPLGKKTTYHFQQFNGVNKVVRVEGHQSTNCAAANKEYSYYPNGLLKTKTDWKGNTTEYKYNDQGLQTEKTEAAGTPQARTITTEWDIEKRLPLKTSDGQLETLYQYNDKGLLINKKQVSK